MKIITVSRQFSSGGRELAKRMADVLGFDYYDREIIAEIAKNKSLDEGFVESSVGVKAIPLHFARSFTFTDFCSMDKTQLWVTLCMYSENSREQLSINNNTTQNIAIKRGNPTPSENILKCLFLYTV